MEASHMSLSPSLPSFILFIWLCCAELCRASVVLIRYCLVRKCYMDRPVYFYRLLCYIQRKTIDQPSSSVQSRMFMKSHTKYLQMLHILCITIFQIAALNFQHDSLLVPYLLGSISVRIALFHIWHASQQTATHVSAGFLDNLFYVLKSTLDEFILGLYVVISATIFPFFTRDFD